MADPTGFGRLFIILGVVLLVVGIVLTLGARVPWLGRLPGDFSFGGGNWRVFIPLGTSLLLSIILTLLFGMFGRK
jgi:hypothetical protein